MAETGCELLLNHCVSEDLAFYYTSALWQEIGVRGAHGTVLTPAHFPLSLTLPVHLYPSLFCHLPPHSYCFLSCFVFFVSCFCPFFPLLPHFFTSSLSSCCHLILLSSLCLGFVQPRTRRQVEVYRNSSSNETFRHHLLSFACCAFRCTQLS